MPAAQAESVPKRCERAEPATARRSGRHSVLLWVPTLTALYLAESLPLLSKVPRAIMDESWEALTGYALAYEGHLRNPVIQNRHGIDRAFIQPRVTQSLVLAAGYRLLGFSLNTGRLASVLVGLLAVWGVFYLMRVWLSPALSWLTALLTSLEMHVFLAARTVRPEVYLLCASIWMVALLARGTVGRGSLPWFGAGVIGAVGCYTHPNMLAVVVLGLVLIFCQVGRHRRTARALAAYTTGGLVGLAPFIAWVAYAQVHYDVHFCGQLGEYYTEIGADSPVALLVRELNRWRTYLMPVHRAPYVLGVALGLIVGLRHRQPVQVWAIVLVVGHALLLPLINRTGKPRYLVVLSPWLAALVVVWAAQLWQWAGVRPTRRRWRHGVRALAVAGIALSLAVNLGGNAYLTYAYRNADYDAMCQRIARHIPTGARVYGRLVFWTGLYKYPYLSDINEEAAPASETRALAQARLVRFRPEYVVRGSDLCWHLDGSGPRASKPVYRAGGLEDEWRFVCDRVDDELIAHCGVLLDRFTTRDFGTIEVYSLRR